MEMLHLLDVASDLLDVRDIDNTNQEYVRGMADIITSISKVSDLAADLEPGDLEHLIWMVTASKARHSR